MELLTFLIIYSTCLFLIFFFCCCLDTEGSGRCSKIAKLIKVDFPNKIWEIIEKVLGKKIRQKGQAGCDYIFNQRNPFLQGFYVVLMSGGYLFAVLFAYPRVPNLLVAGYHRALAAAFVVACFGSWFVACRVEPGILTKRNVSKYDNYELDNLFYEGKDCVTCKTKKIARSKHCALCNVCVARFDHHCGWINQCVGERNHKHFIVFLLVHICTLLYGAIILSLILLNTVLEQELWRAQFFNTETNEVQPATTTMIIRYVAFSEGKLTALFVVCLVMGIVLVCFTGHHIRLVLLNMTSNESFKWAALHRAIKQEQREYNTALKELEAAKKQKTNENSSEDSENECEIPECPPDLPENIYYISLYQNMLEVLKPRVYSRSKKIVQLLGKKKQ